MNHFSTDNMSSFCPIKDYDTSTGFDPVALLMRNKHRAVESEPTLSSVVQYDPKDVQELEEFCRSRGIISLGMGNGNPKAMLAVLKSQMGIREEPAPKKGIIYG